MLKQLQARSKLGQTCQNQLTNSHHMTGKTQLLLLLLPQMR